MSTLYKASKRSQTCSSAVPDFQVSPCLQGSILSCSSGLLHHATAQRRESSQPQISDNKFASASVNPSLFCWIFLFSSRSFRCYFKLLCAGINEFMLFWPFLQATAETGEFTTTGVVVVNSPVWLWTRPSGCELEPSHPLCAPLRGSFLAGAFFFTCPFCKKKNKNLVGVCLINRPF